MLASALVLGLVGGLIGGFAGGFAGERSDSSSSSESTGSSTSGPSGDLSQIVCDATMVADSVLPTIVTISVESSSGSGVGSGSIIREDGYILTNNHVISAAATEGSITVLFSNGESEAATLVGRAPKADIAVLKVDASATLPAIEIGDSESLVVGQPVVALGAPLGLASTVTTGIVSALGRDVTVPSDDDQLALLAGAIQTDAAINPGNSGGALVDCSGAQIGVNTAIATVGSSEASGNVGIGFAVPMSLAQSIVDQLIENGTVAYPYMGIGVVLISADAAEKFDTPQGLFVDTVTAGSPAAEAGLQEGDIITELDGQPATTLTVLTRIQLTKKVGDVVSVTYLRDGTEATTDVTLGTEP
ncbi:S1C family serine protease [Leifsonia sp. A12D58]|uniref:S1C family serine protease n=1 Tax=Leifsonia sp. A12D58 TaxID=3397674 RepID=UPI0039DFC786